MTIQTDRPSETPPPFAKGQVEEVAATWGLSGNLAITPFHRGENHHYLCRDGAADYFLRVSPPRGQEAGALASELAWIEVLSKMPGGTIATPRILKTREGKLFHAMSFGDELRFVVMLETLYGFHLTDPTRDDWHHYGQTLRTFHEAAKRILETADASWIGRDRPGFSPQTFILDACETLLRAPWIEPDLAQAFAKEAAHLSEAVRRSSLLDDAQSFIHFDLHLANLLLTPDVWILLDFEECRFGPRAIDLGVVRLHARSEGRLEAAWGPFREGYGDASVADNAPLGAALRALFLAGKIPNRMDVPDVEKDPHGILRGLLKCIRQEIN